MHCYTLLYKNKEYPEGAWYFHDMMEEETVEQIEEYLKECEYWYPNKIFKMVELDMKDYLVTENLVTISNKRIITI